MRDKRREPKKTVKRIVKLIRAGKVRFAGDPRLFNPRRSAEERQRNRENPEFVEIGLFETWKKWRSKKDRLAGNNGGFDVHWGAKGIGFGSATFLLDKKNRLHVRTERMGKDFVKKALMALVDSAILDE